jgi:type IV pilus assembly protein PilV
MCRKHSKGFTLIEVLVSLVILSIGILGLGVLQLTSLQNTQGGYLRSQATIHAYSIIDSMRANIPSVSNGNYDLAMGAATPVAVSCYGLEADCTTAQMATADLSRWRTILNAHLPNGNGQIATANLGTTTQVTIQVQWIDPYSAAAGNESMTLVSELPQ